MSETPSVEVTAGLAGAHAQVAGPDLPAVTHEYGGDVPQADELPTEGAGHGVD